MFKKMLIISGLSLATISSITAAEKPKDLEEKSFHVSQTVEEEKKDDDKVESVFASAQEEQEDDKLQA